MALNLNTIQIEFGFWLEGIIYVKIGATGAISRYFLGDLWHRHKTVQPRGVWILHVASCFFPWELHSGQELYKLVSSLFKVIIIAKIYLLLLNKLGCGMVQWFVHILKITVPVRSNQRYRTQWPQKCLENFTEILQDS